MSKQSAASQPANPFRPRLQRAQERLRKLEGQWARLEANAVPGPFVTGNSGIPAVRRRKLDSQLERTVDLSAALVKARAHVGWLQAQHDAYARGEINAQGRAVRPKGKEPQGLPEFERLEDRIFISDLGSGPTWTDRRVRPQDDFKPIVTVDKRTLEPCWYRGRFPENLLALVRGQVEAYRERRRNELEATR
mgnify:FL=1